LNLSQWLEYLEQCHPSNIELGLDRVNTVAERLSISFPNSRIITVGGTNGKGSTVQMLSTILEKAEYSTGCYTSPHIQVYNERVRLGSRLATDRELCDSFAAVEAVRGETRLTYFEFGTLAAFQLFSVQEPDFIILEIGLGGRLDAVNILDPDLAILTNVALDHMDWLGETREEIGFEKAGIFRPNTPALIGEKDIPATVTAHAADIGAWVFANGQQFTASAADDRWQWQGRSAMGEPVEIHDLPLNDFPLDNCATVLQAITLIAPDISEEVIRSGLKEAELTGRFQQIDRGYPLVLDVAHNPHAAKRLVEQVNARFPDHDLSIVIAMLADKNYREVLATLQALSPRWYVAGIQEVRGLEGKMLYNHLAQSGEENVQCFSTVQEAFEAAESEQNGTKRDSVLLVTGSFFTVTGVLETI